MAIGGEKCSSDGGVEQPLEEKKVVVVMVEEENELEVEIKKVEEKEVEVKVDMLPFRSPKIDTLAPIFQIPLNFTKLIKP